MQCWQKFRKNVYNFKPVTVKMIFFIHDIYLACVKLKYKGISLVRWKEMYFISVQVFRMYIFPKNISVAF